MNLKTTLALLALVGAGAAWLWYHPQQPSATVSEQGTREVLKAFQPDRFTYIKVNRTGDNTVLQRRADGSWSLPGNWPIRTAEVQSLLDLLAGLRSRFEAIPLAGDADLKVYGLDHPAVTVEVRIDGKMHTLEFAEKAEGVSRFSRETYLRLDKKPEVVRLGPGVIAALDRPTDYYQQRRLFSGERVAKDGSSPEKIERLAAKSVSVEEKKPNETHFGLTRQGDAWEVADPVRDRLEATSRDALLAAVPDIWAEQFITVPPAAVARAFLAAQTDNLTAGLAVAFWASPAGALTAAGLTNPERTLTVQNDKGDDVTLLIGGLSSSRMKLVPAPQMPGQPPLARMMPVNEDYRYAKLKNNDQLFEIKADKLKDVFVSLDTLRDPRVARFSTADARKVELKHGSEDIVLEKDKDRWKLVKPFAADADTTKVTDLLNKLSDLQARDKDVIDKADPQSYGLDKPDALITVRLEEEVKDSGEEKAKKTRTLTVRVGKHDKEKKKLYVQADEWPRVNAVDDSLEPLVNRPALAYRGKRVLEFAAGDLAKIEIQQGSETFTLEKTKDDWRLLTPVKADADRAKVDQLITTLSGLEAMEYVNEAPKPEDLEAQYGLGKPAVIVKLEFTDKKPAQVLQMGKAHGKGYFARVANQPEKATPVFVVSGDVHKQLERDSLSYRPLQLWQVMPDDIVALRIHKEGQKEYRLQRSEGDWKISGPFQADALGPTVQKMTTDLGSPQAESCKAHETKDLAAYGLDKPALTIGVTARDGKEHTLLIGKPVAKDAQAHFAKLGEGSAVYQVGPTLVHAADHAALDLLDPVLLHLDPSRLERIQAKSGEEKLTLEKKGEDWRVAESPGGPFPADTEETAGLASLWANLRAERFVDYGTDVDWSKYGLDKPAVIVTAKERPTEAGAAAPTHTVELGKVLEGDTGTRYARVDRGPGVAVLAADASRLLGRSYLDYVNHNVLKFDSMAVTELQRHMGPEVLDVVKKDDAWQITKPGAESADNRAMQDLLGRLANLRAQRIAAYPVKNLKEFGLDAPAALVTIKLTAGNKPAEHILKVGKATGAGERFAVVDAEPVVAVLPAPLVERLLGGPVTFRDRNIARFSDADRLRLERGPRNAVFGKVEGSWKLIEPIQGDAEQDELDDFLNSLARLRADALVTDKPTADDLKKYGLDHPEARWRLQAGDKEVLNLLVGNKEANGPRRYARLADRDLVFLLDPRLSGKVLAEYRPRTVFTPPIDAAQVDALRYEQARNPFVLEKTGGDWQAPGKPDVKINKATVEDTLGALAGLKLDHYAVDKGANLVLFGLDKPEVVLEVASRSGKRVLHIGGREGGSKRRYARLPESDRSDVFVLDEATCDRLLRDLTAFTKPLPGPAQ
jgi:hypothetical protein